MATGLEKLAIEVPFKQGLSEKIHPDMAEPEGFYLIENAELDKVGGFRRRRGFTVMSSAIINSLTPSGAPLKVGPRDDEIFKINEDVGALGSGGGSGAAGATLYSYSPEADAWRDTGKVPSVTLDRFTGLANGQSNPKTLDVGYVSHLGKEFVLLAYTNGEFNSQNAGIYLCVYDATSRSMVLEPTLIDTTASYGGKVQVVSIGRRAVILYRESILSATFVGRIYDASDNSLSNEIALFTASDEGQADIWCATTDGTSLFLAYTVAAGADIFVERYTVTTTLTLAAQATTTASVTGGVWISYAGGTLHVCWTQTGTGVKYWATSTVPASLVTPATISTNTDGTARSYIAGLNSAEAVIFWDRQGDTGTDFSVRWRWVKNGTTAPAGRTNEHASPGVQVVGAPFVYNNRVFVPLCGCSYLSPTWETQYTVNTGLGPGITNFGICLAEVNSDTALEDAAGGNAYSTFLPVAVWARDVSRWTLPALGAFGGNSDRYIATVRQARQADAYFIETRGVQKSLTHTVSVWSLDVIRINLNDSKRWQHAEGNQATLIASALPYVYDGMNVHECGYVFRPAILSVAEVGSGSYSAGDVANYKVVFEWEDVRGARWFSDSSYTLSHTVVGAANVTLELKVRAPAMTAKPLGGFQFTGRVRVNLYRARQDAPDDYRLLETVSFMVFDGSGNPILSYGVFNDGGVLDLEQNERIYIFGNELDNSLMPPCRSVVQHRDRFFCIDTENNKLWYSKPFNRDRGYEWSRFQTLALPSTGVGLESIEGALVIYCERQILVLEGGGPGSTGQPADAYSRFSVLTQDQGCSEVNASWRFPGGSIFRSPQGLWLIGGNLGLEYIGAAVEDVVRTVTNFIDGSVDESLGCVRLLATDGSTFFMLNYWYDTGRWSVDRYASVAGTMYSCLYHLGEFYIASTSGMLKRLSYRRLDGPDADTAVTTDVYLMKVRTGRLRLDSLASFKRLWRVLSMVRFDDDQDAVSRGGPTGPGCDVQVTVETLGAPGGTTTWVFSGEDFESGVPATLRAHVKFQKGQSYLVTIEEVTSLDTKLAIHGPHGYTFLGIGLELGTKRAAAKQVVGRSL